MTDRIGVVYIKKKKKKTKLSRLIGSGAVYDENKKGQQHDQSCRSGLCQKLY